MHWCPACVAYRDVSEQNAFGGRDKTRMTLKCGHVVLKEKL